MKVPKRKGRIKKGQFISGRFDGQVVQVVGGAQGIGKVIAARLARELGPHGINVNCVGPGFIRTRLTAPIMKDRKFMKKYANLLSLWRLGWPENIAGPATFLASPDADYVTGVLLFVDGGQLA